MKEILFPGSGFLHDVQSEFTDDISELCASHLYRSNEQIFLSGGFSGGLFSAL
jgi:hypothetical protein